MFQPVSRVTETSSDFGAFPWSVSKRKVLTNSTCVQRELLTHGSVLQTFESKKMTMVILTRVELNSWIDLCCVFLKDSRRV